jgi:hypothetical protein
VIYIILRENRSFRPPYSAEGNRKKRNFEGKIIVIIGASSGIGRQAALDL